MPKQKDSPTATAVVEEERDDTIKEQDKKPAWECCSCHKTRDKPAKRLPTGWKRLGNDDFCDTCWGDRYILRAVTMQVVSPVDMEWPQLRTQLKEMWGATTQACNWMLTQLYAQDIRRNGEPKMPPMPKTYLYPDARARYPQLPSNTVASLEQAVTKKYKAKRYEVVWTCTASLPTYRYPTPYPVPNQAWSVDFENDSPVVSLRVGDKRIGLRLKGSPRFFRQLASVRQIANGTAIQGQLDLYQQGNHLLCKMVAWLPRRAKVERTGMLNVRTDATAIIVALNIKDEKLWTYHAKHLPRWTAEHRERLQEWSDDSKAEQRPEPAFAQRRQQATQKYRDRMNTATHEIAAMVANYANRRKFQTVTYDDTERSFVPDFPWFRLRELIAQKCDAYGIGFEYTGKAPADAAAGNASASAGSAS